ncbi:MAG: TlyA family RNA methyltransferase [Synergistaceae bacterium]|jgi:23S rRNA (cytidine1920-2'-O)/16S rRNA (cytidine1409-2'-O)-methyltransferase|nr:TlyA family RNA methyltransferase [Synergistaceae bacterium]
MKGSTRLRLDKLLVAKGLASSRAEASELIEGGRVAVAGLVKDKPASLFAEDSHISVSAEDGERWVSRGAHKLMRALDEWGVDPSGRDCIDIGASTGGFTQVLLHRGANRVTAVDVGYGQLAWVLRSDPRVRALERTNARYVSHGDIGWMASLLTVDASFISLRLLLPNLQNLVFDGGTIIALVKPQFEVGRRKAGRGVVRDASLHLEVLEGLSAFVRDETELCLDGVTHSPIRGPEGNIEFIFLLTRRRGEEAGRCAANFAARVHEAHACLG